MSVFSLYICDTFLRAIAECFTRLSHGLGVCPSVCLSVCLSVRHTAVLCQARITKFSPWAASRTLVFHDNILCPWVWVFPSNKNVKEWYPLKRRYFALLARLVWKRLQIGTDMLLIITSTC